MLPASLQIPAFRRLLAATTLSVLGSLMTFVVLPVVAWEETGSSATFAFVMSGGALGMLVAMPFGGVIADRFDRRRVLLVGDACQVVITLAMFVAVQANAWWALPFVNLCATFVGSLFASAGPALRRDVLTDDVRTQGNALFMAGQSTANLLGPVLGGAVYVFAGFTAVILVDLVSYALSFLLVLGLRTDVATRVAPVDDAPIGVGAAMHRTAGDLRSGIAVAWRDPFLRRCLAAGLFGGFSNGLVIVAIVPWFDLTLGLPASTWGIAMAVMGGSGLVGALVVARLGERIAPRRLLAVGSLSFLLGSVLLVGTPSMVRLVVAFALIGCTNTALSVAITGTTQRRVASSHQGRISSLFVCSFQLTQFAASLFAGVALDAIGPGTAVHVAIATFSVSALLTWSASRVMDTAPTTFTEDDLALGA